MEKFDCVVIGAGLYGLASARHHHRIHPDRSLVVLEGQLTAGGTWAQERLYSGLKANNLLGTLQYPDFPLDPERFGAKPGNYIPGIAIHKYFTAYAEEFGVRDKIRFGCKVLSAEHQDETENGGWVLTVTQRGSSSEMESQEQKLYARHLVIATGITSEPFMPHFKGQENFGGRIFHGKQFEENIDLQKTAKSIAIFGGSKFTWDAAYSYANAGVEVNWIIRSSGSGPAWMSPSYVTPFKKWIEKLANTRFLTWFSPCIWGDADGYSGIRHLLHGTMLGRALVRLFWMVLGQDVIMLNRYDAHPGTAKLKPWTGAMYSASSFSILNYETDFFDLVREGKINVHIGDIDHLSPGKVHLADGTDINADALLAHSGWVSKPPVKFLPEGIEKELGIPHAVQTEGDPKEDTELSRRADLLERADREILSRFAILADGHTRRKGPYVSLKDSGEKDRGGMKSREMTPWMLHRFMIPPSRRFLEHRDTIFVSAVSNFSNPITAWLQGLWASAYFSGELESDPARVKGEEEIDEEALTELQYQTFLLNRFGGRWRYPADWGWTKGRAPSFIFDAVPYLDLLQRDLGLSPYRKSSALAELYDPYGPEDYATVAEEWMARRAGKN